MALSDFIKKRGGALTDVDEDKGGKKRELEGAWKYIITALCLSLAAFQLYAAGSGLVDDKYVVSVHLAVIILLIYLLFPATKHSSSKAPTVIDIILGLLSFCAALYVAVFAKKINAKKIGIATCVGLLKESRILADILRRHGFEVYGVGCKAGTQKKTSVGIPECCEGVGVNMCNPILQAKLLNKAKTDLNVVVGLCVGHDSLFYKYSEALTTTAVTKDRVLGHNPVAALYTADSYYSKLKKSEEE